MEGFGLKVLRMKTLVPAVLATALLLLGLGVFMGMRAKAAFSADMASRAESMAASLEKAAIPHLLKLDTASLERFVVQALKDPDVESIVFYDAEGNALTRNRHNESISKDALLQERELKDPISQAIIGRMRCAFSLHGLASQSRQDLVAVAAAVGGGGLMVVMSVVCLFRRRTRASDPAMDVAVCSMPDTIAAPPPSLHPRVAAGLDRAEVK